MIFLAVNLDSFSSFRGVIKKICTMEELWYTSCISDWIFSGHFWGLILNVTLSIYSILGSEEKYT